MLCVIWVVRATYLGIACALVSCVASHDVVLKVEEHCHLICAAGSEADIELLCTIVCNRPYVAQSVDQVHH